MNDNLATILLMLPTLTVEQLSTLQVEVRLQCNSKMRQRGIDGTLTDDERDAIDRRDLMAAVRSIRDRTGLGLRDAKEYMDRARVR
jgi:hypothetical protein